MINSLYQVNEIRKLEKDAVQKFKISVDELMLRAGKNAFVELKNYWPETRNIVVVCGKGNNAGDGYVVAYLAKKARFNVRVLQLASETELKGAAKRAALKCKKLNIDIKKFSEKELASADLIVDAILGTGLAGKVKPKFKNAIQAINGFGAPVLSLDVPSGVDADSGKVLDAAICADVTVTFIGNKIGLFMGDAKDYCGEIICHDLELPTELFKKTNCSFQLLNLFDELKQLEPRRHDSHKGDFGHVLIVGGDYGMGGAVRIAAEAALRVGAGLVTVATRPENVVAINGARPEVMVHGVSQAKDLKPLLANSDVIVIGPGLGKSDWGKNLFDLVMKSKKRMVVDADALRGQVLTNDNETLTKKSKEDCSLSGLAPSNWILTPHPGEAARLLKITSGKIQDDRLGAIQKIVKKFGGVTVLKGAGSLVFAEREKIRLCGAGNPGMASAGMGDLLTGIIAGLLAQGLGLFDAAKLGVLVHAEAGDLVAAQNGERGMLALDLLPAVRDIVNIVG